jgi:mRNA-degrading endonuclease RelE of RelBE toxin-antitoxin system
MLYSIVIHEDAEIDLDALWEIDEDSTADIEALLEQAACDQKLLDNLTARDFGSNRSEEVHVEKWFEQQRKGRNLWRLKIWDLEDRGIRYRIIYALDPRISRYHVLGVVHRDFNYDERDARTQRILAAYDELGIPNY